MYRCPGRWKHGDPCASDAAAGLQGHHREGCCWCRRSSKGLGISNVDQLNAKCCSPIVASVVWLAAACLPIHEGASPVEHCTFHRCHGQHLHAASWRDSCRTNTGLPAKVRFRGLLQDTMQLGWLHATRQGQGQTAEVEHATARLEWTKPGLRGNDPALLAHIQRVQRSQEDCDGIDGSNGVLHAELVVAAAQRRPASSEGLPSCCSWQCSNGQHTLCGQRSW